MDAKKKGAIKISEIRNVLGVTDKKKSRNDLNQVMSQSKSTNDLGKL